MVLHGLKTDLGVKMGVFKDGEFNGTKINVLKGHFEGHDQESHIDFFSAS